MNRGPKDRTTTEHGYVEERLSAYLDGRLSSQEQRVVEHHLARCPACRWNLRTLQQTVQWTRELPTVPVPRAFTLPVAPRARVVAPPRRSWLPLLQGATALVALLLVFVVAGDLLLLGLWPASAPRPVAMPQQPAAQVEVTQEVALLEEAGPSPSEKVEKAAVAASPTPSLFAQPEMVQEVPPQGTVQAEGVAGSPLPSVTQESMAELMVAEPLSPAITPTVEMLGLGGAISEPQPIEGSAMAMVAPVTEPFTLPTLDMAMARSWTTETVPLTPPSLPATSPVVVPYFTTPIPEVQELVPRAETKESAVISPSIGISPTVTVEAPAVSSSPAVEAEALVVGPSPTVEMKALPSARASIAPTPQPTAAPTQVEEEPPAPTALAAAPQPAAPTPVGQLQEPVPAGEDSERAALAFDRTSFVVWLRAAEIGLGTLFVVLATVTLVLMIGRRQAR